MKLRLGTRASTLAAWQAAWVAEQLAEKGIQIEPVSISTTGDRHRQGPIERIGTQGVFTKEIQHALLDNRIDLAVHSLKDLSTEPVAGLRLAAVPRRGPIVDVLVFRDVSVGSLEDLPDGAVVGTGSLRRKTQLLHERRDLRIENVRGNVETRLSKLDAGTYDAVVLAEAGLRRLGLDGRIGEVLSPTIMLPAVGQGALGIEARENDERTGEVLQSLDDPPTRAAVMAERAMLAELQGGCAAPIAGWGRMEDGVLRLDGRVLRIDGSQRLDATSDGCLEEPETLGRNVAGRLLDGGAAELIREARQS